MNYLSTYPSSFDAIMANRTLAREGLDTRLMPVPRSLSASCGTCVRFQAEGVPQALDQVRPMGVYHEVSAGWVQIR